MKGQAEADDDASLKERGKMAVGKSQATDFGGKYYFVLSLLLVSTLF